MASTVYEREMRAGDIAWAIVLCKPQKSENNIFYQSKENGISYTKKIPNNFLKNELTRYGGVTHALRSCLLENLTDLNF